MDSSNPARHSRSQESPLPLFLSFEIHAVTRSRCLVVTLFNVGLCVSHDKLLRCCWGSPRLSLSKEVGAVVKDVYVHLGHTDLLGRCLIGKTQNLNESLHSVVWRKCPKTGFVGLSRVVFATSAVVSEFNSDLKATLQMAYNVMGS